MCALFFKMDKARYVYNTGGLLFIVESCESHTVSNGYKYVYLYFQRIRRLHFSERGVGESVDKTALNCDSIER